MRMSNPDLLEAEKLTTYRLLNGWLAISLVTFCLWLGYSAITFIQGLF